MALRQTPECRVQYKCKSCYVHTQQLSVRETVDGGTDSAAKLDANWQCDYSCRGQL